MADGDTDEKQLLGTFENPPRQKNKMKKTSHVVGNCLEHCDTGIEKSFHHWILLFEIIFCFFQVTVSVDLGVWSDYHWRHRRHLPLGGAELSHLIATKGLEQKRGVIAMTIDPIRIVFSDDKLSTLW